MRVRFRTNLGSVDAEALNKRHGCTLDCRECIVDAVVVVPAKAGEELLDRGIVAAVEDPPIKGEAKKPEVTAPKK